MAPNAPPWRGRRPRHTAIGLAVLMGALHGAAGAVSPLHSSLRKPGELVYDAFSCGGDRRGVERRACRERDVWNCSQTGRLAALPVVRLIPATRSKTVGGGGAISVQHAWSPRRRKRAWHASARVVRSAIPPDPAGACLRGPPPCFFGCVWHTAPSKMDLRRGCAHQTLFPLHTQRSPHPDTHHVATHHLGGLIDQEM